MASRVAEPPTDLVLARETRFPVVERIFMMKRPGEDRVRGARDRVPGPAVWGAVPKRDPPY